MDERDPDDDLPVDGQDQSCAFCGGIDSSIRRG
jgi:hypothetical protein